jgi:glycerol uptake facilitator-like aquaporin
MRRLANAMIYTSTTHTDDSRSRKDDPNLASQNPPMHIFWRLARLIATRWPEYGIEAALLGLFMISACVFTVLFQLPSSLVRENVPSAFLRRAMTGAAMGLTAIALIYSPWGQRSGAHINPSVTLTYYRLGKIHVGDAVLYIFSQFVGGIAGVMIAAHLLGTSVAHSAVHYAATYPGQYGTFPAALSELIISFLLMLMVLYVSNHATLSRFTGLFCRSPRRILHRFRGALFRDEHESSTNLGLGVAIGHLERILDLRRCTAVRHARCGRVVSTKHSPGIRTVLQDVPQPTTILHILRSERRLPWVTRNITM